MSEKFSKHFNKKKALAEVKRVSASSFKSLYKRSTRKNRNTNLMFAIIKYYPKDKWITYKDVALDFGVNQTNINKYVRNLVELKMVIKKGKPVKFKIITKDYKALDKFSEGQIGRPYRERDFSLAEDPRWINIDAIERERRFNISKRGLIKLKKLKEERSYHKRVFGIDSLYYKRDDWNIKKIEKDRKEARKTLN